MALSPTSFIAINYRDFKNYWLKAYEPGTTTPKTMALDSEGVTTVAKLELNADGFLESAGGALVIPYIDGFYDAWLFPTEAEADANDTINAERVADNIVGVNGAILANSAVFKFDVLQDAVDETNGSIIFDGAALSIKERTTGNEGGAMWDVVLSGSTPNVDLPNTFNIVQCVGVPTLALVLRTPEVIDIKQFGATGDPSNVIDDYPSIQAAIDYSEIRGLSVHIPAGVYGITQTLIVGLNKTCKIFGDGIRNSIFKKLADVTGLIVPKDGIDNSIVMDIKIEGIDAINDPSLHVNETTAGAIFYRKMERVNIFVQYCGGPGFTDPYPQAVGVTNPGYAVAILNDNSNTNNTKDFQVFSAHSYGDALYVGVVSGTRDCNGMKIQARSFNCSGFTVNAQKGFRNKFEILSAQGDLQSGVVLCADTENEFDIQYVESGDFEFGAIAEAARNVFNFVDASGIITPFTFNNPNNIYRDLITRYEFIGGNPVPVIEGTPYAHVDGIRIGGSDSGNTLSIYEEGSWDAEVHDAVSGGNVSPTTVTGYYIRTGNSVLCTLINLNNIDTTGLTPGNTLHITLPVDTASTTGKICTGQIGLDDVALPGGRTHAVLSTSQNSDKALIIAFGNNISDIALKVEDFTSGNSDISRFTMTYIA